MKKKYAYKLIMDYHRNTDTYIWSVSLDYLYERSSDAEMMDDRYWQACRFGKTNVDSDGTHWLPVQHRMPDDIDVMFHHATDREGIGPPLVDSTYFWVRQDATAWELGDDEKELTDSELTRLLQRIHTNWRNCCQTKT